MTPLQLKKACAALVGCHHSEISEVHPVAYQFTVEKTVPGTNHVRQTTTYTVNISG